MQNNVDKPIAYFLITLGAVFIILLSLSALGVNIDPVSLALWEAFHIGGYYIPALSFTGAFLLLNKPLNRRLFYYVAASVVIFFPFSTLLKLLTSDKRDPVLNWFLKTFDKSGSSFGTSLILLFINVIFILTARVMVKFYLGELENQEKSNPGIDLTKRNFSSISIDELEEEYSEKDSTEDLDQEEEPHVNECYVEEDQIEEDQTEEDIYKDYTYEDEPNEEEAPAFDLNRMKEKIASYYEAGTPFEEPEIPETTELVDIDALDHSIKEMSSLVDSELHKYEDNNQEETFVVPEIEELEEDPAYNFLAGDIKSTEEYEYSEPVDYDDFEENDNYEEEEYEEYEDEDDYEEEYVDEEDEEPTPYDIPVENLLENSNDNSYMEIDDATKRSAAILEQTLEEFKIQGKVTGIKKGPVITMFELLPAPGVKLSKIVNLSDNIALGLAASTVRIVAPIPGKHAVGIEVPNKKRAVVSFGDLIEDDNSIYTEAAVPIVLGKDISGENKIIDLARTPHLLIAGATGAGKSVCVNSLVCSILCKRSHNDVKLIMVDPKIVELKLYNGIPHLLTPVITDPKKAFQAIQWLLYEMERRYALLDSIGVRDIDSYNKRIKEQRIATTKLPYIVLLVDEFADLMATSGKELEGILARLAAMSRAVGIHLVLATQRPSIDVITGLIKANFPSRIAFMVSSKTDSRIILDSVGAEKLLGRGDMLFTSSWEPFPVRVQGSFLSDEEVESVVDFVKTMGEPEYIDDEIFIDDDEDEVTDTENIYGDDPLFNRALEIVLNARKASASFLQRRLKIGYNRAARLVEEMEERGIIGPQNGSKPRDILRIPDSHREVEEFV